MLFLQVLRLHMGRGAPGVCTSTVSVAPHAVLESRPGLEPAPTQLQRTVGIPVMEKIWKRNSVTIRHVHVSTIENMQSVINTF